jgi:UDP-glucose 4-epimerase
MNILITGGAGYIGSHATRILLDQGHKVVVVDNLSTGYVDAVDERASFYQEDIHNTEKLIDILMNNKIEGVIHFAAFSLVGESMEKPLKYYQNNVSGTKGLLDAMLQAKIPYIVFSSTAAVYGDQTIMPITEDIKPEPTNTYGATKLAMEEMMKWTSKAYNLKYVSLRYFNVAGAHHSSEIGERHNPETHLIPIVLQVPLKERDSIHIFGTDYDTFDGTCIRDYIHIEDLIDAHIKAMKYLINGGKSDVFNLGSGSGYSVKQIIEAAKKVTKQPIKTKEEKRRAGDPAKLIASSDKAKHILQWEVKHPDVEDIISSAWAFHQKHQGVGEQ